MKKIIKKLFKLRIIVPTLLILFFIGMFCDFIPIERFRSSTPFKNNSAYTYSKQFNKLLIVSNSEESVSFEPYYDNPEHLFQDTKRLIKDIREMVKIPTKVALVEIEGHPYIVKKYHRVNFLHWAKIFPIRRSQAYKAWYYADLFDQLGVPTAKPLLLVEKTFGPFWITGYTVHEYLDGIKASQYFGHCTEFDEGWKESLQELKKIMKTLDQSHIAHGDFHLDNIMIQNGQPVLIDLDYVRHYHSSYAFKLRSRYKKDLKKLSMNLKKRGGDLINSLFEDVFELDDQILLEREL